IASVAAIIFFVFCSFFVPDLFSLIAPDSQSYIDFSAQRLTGYPMFIHLVLATGLELQHIPTIQICLFAGVLFYFIHQLIHYDTQLLSLLSWLLSLRLTF
ncbi:MAG: hypothetical protein AAF403_01245, partial [Pseudomonadota bacterium]